MQKPIRLNLRISENTDGKLTELTRLLSAKVGAVQSRTQAIEAAIDFMLEAFHNNKNQGRLI